MFVPLFFFFFALGGLSAFIFHHERANATVHIFTDAEAFMVASADNAVHRMRVHV